MPDKLISINEASKILNVSKDTLRRWDKDDIFPSIRTVGVNRKYLLSAVEEKAGLRVENKEKDSSIKVAIYCRVSSNEQKTKGDLDRQKIRTVDYCVSKKYTIVEVFDEVGSGLNDNRVKLHRMIKMSVEGSINKIIIEHSDRLTRFNFKIFEVMFDTHGVKIECIEHMLGKSFEEELTSDMIAIMASFSAKIYGKRSHKNILKIKSDG